MNNRQMSARLITFSQSLFLTSLWLKNVLKKSAANEKTFISFVMDVLSNALWGNLGVAIATMHTISLNNWQKQKKKKYKKIFTDTLATFSGDKTKQKQQQHAFAPVAQITMNQLPKSGVLNKKQTFIFSSSFNTKECFFRWIKAEVAAGTRVGLDNSRMVVM